MNKEINSETVQQLRDGAQELINCGNSHEKATGWGMLDVLVRLGFLPMTYFDVVKKEYNGETKREEIHIRAGEHGDIYIHKTDEGFTVNVHSEIRRLVKHIEVSEDELSE